MFPNLDWKVMQVVNPDMDGTKHDHLIFGRVDDKNHFMVGEAFGKTERDKPLLRPTEVWLVAKLFSISPKLYQVLQRLVETPQENTKEIQRAWDDARILLAEIPGGIDGLSEQVSEKIQLG